MCSATTRVILPEPSEELKCVSTELAEIISAAIRRDGPIPFSEYMEMALYQPALGYYSAGLKKFGEGGDFVTAPQMGDVFARCLAKQIEQIGDHLDDYEIVEAGAGSGVLAADLLMALEHSHPPERYSILERSAHLRQVQKDTLSHAVPGWVDRIRWLGTPPADTWQGIFLANEVIDALTVERFCIEENGISQLLVGAGNAGFEWHRRAFSPQVQKRLDATLGDLVASLPKDYCSEINIHLPAWLEAVTASLDSGAALFIDYGYPRHEYYLPQRSDGTLVCHYQQRVHDDPFLWPGLTDISASVDFTALAEAADHCALEVSGYTTQAMFLLACGLEEIMAGFQSLSAREQLLKNNEVRRLTLPGEMGERFQVMVLGRALDFDLRGFSLSDLRHRL